MKTRRRSQIPEADSPVELPADDVLGGFELADLLAGRGRPGHADAAADARWREARRYVLRIADAEFDPRQLLDLEADAAADWRDSRLRWVRRNLDTNRIKFENGERN